MADRILSWFKEGTGLANGRHFLDRDYEPKRVRIYAETTPVGGDLKIDIKDDGTSIMSSGYAILGRTENSTNMAGDFVQGVTIAQGSWLSMEVVETNGANDITVQLELHSDIDEVDEDELGYE